jgi:predicted methyltransferase
MRRIGYAFWVAAALAAFTVGAADAPKIDPAIAAAVANKDRPAADREKDASRKPAVVLEFFGVRPGQTLVEYMGGTGNTAELLARVVGPKGKVYLQNPPEMLTDPKRLSELEARLANQRLPNVERLDKPFDALGLPKNSIDGAVMNLVFHDMVWITGNVPAVLKNLYGTLKPGGFVGVVDHAAPAGTKDEYAKDRKGQHRIDEEYTKQLFKDAGFVLEGENDALRNPEDDRSKPFFAPEWKDSAKFTDRFALKFRKPKK